MKNFIFAALAALAIAPVSAMASDVSFSSTTPVVEVEPAQPVFSKFTLRYSLACGEAKDTVSAFSVKTEAQSRSLITGREDQALSVFGFGPLVFVNAQADGAQAQNPSQQAGQGQQVLGCVGNLKLESIVPAVPADSTTESGAL